MILITGATGKTGSEVSRQLAAGGVAFRALVHSPERVAVVKDWTDDIAIGDYADDDAIAKALDGISRVLMIVPNGENQLTLENNFTDLCGKLGVQHLVKLSSMEATAESPAPIPKMHVASENYIKQSDLDWTLIKPTFFMQNFVNMAPKIREQNQFALPMGEGMVPATDLRDVGEVIKKVLTEEGHNGQSYIMTGPEVLTFAQIAERFSAVLGRDIAYVDQPMEEYRAILSSVGLSDWRVNAVCLEFAEIAKGVADHTTDTIQNLLGRAPRSFDQFIEDHRDLFTSG